MANSKSPGELPAQKVTFCGVQFWSPLLGVSKSSGGEYWGSFWKLLGLLFGLSDKVFEQSSKNSLLGVFFGAKFKRLLLQNHANRIVHPLKIEDELTQDSVLPNVSQRDLFCFPKACFGGFKLYYKTLLFGTWCKLTILSPLGVVWGFNFVSFWRA